MEESTPQDPKKLQPSVPLPALSPTELSKLPSGVLMQVAPNLPVATLRKLTKILLDNAMEPNATYEDVRCYMITHREILNRSNRFSSQWAAMLMADPYFDFPEDHMPLSSPAQDIWAKVTREEREKKLRKIAQETTLAFFSDDSPYSTRQREVIDQLHEQYGFRVYEITKQEADKKRWILQRTEYPTVFLYLKKGSQIMRLGSGYMVYNQLRQRIIKAYDLLTNGFPNKIVHYQPQEAQ